MASIALRRVGNESWKSFKIIVTRLPWTVGTNELREHFKKFGVMQTCAVLFNKDTGFSRNTGVIRFKDESSYNEALQAEHELDGKVVRVDPAAEQEPFRFRRNQTTANRSNLRRNVENVLDSI